MHNRLRPFIAVALFALAGGLQPTTAHAIDQDTPMTTRATGPFDVKLAPLPAYNQDEGAGLMRMSIDKQFHGELEASSRGEFLGTRSGDSGGYVAIERVTGTLAGKRGSFVLQHSSTALGGVQEQHIIVSSGSGTDELVGLSGRMVIVIKDGGAHFYEFDYQLAP